jgi:hypothetical protein
LIAEAELHKRVLKKLELDELKKQKSNPYSKNRRSSKKALKKEVFEAINEIIANRATYGILRMNAILKRDYP